MPIDFKAFQHYIFSYTIQFQNCTVSVQGRAVD